MFAAGWAIFSWLKGHGKDVVSQVAAGAAQAAQQAQAQAQQGQDEESY